MNDAARPAPAAVREVEHKFSVAALFELPDLSIGGRYEVRAEAPITHTAVYYDAPDLRLFRWGITLRRREGGSDAGWHLKLPRAVGGAKHVRDELQLPLRASASGPPEDFVRLLPGMLRGASLHPVVTLRTVRRPFLVGEPGGPELVEVVDDTVSVLNGRAVAGRFREVELEERPEGAAAAAQLSRVLLESGAIPSGISKAAAALGPGAVAPADVARPGPVGPDVPAEQAVRAYLATQVRALLFADLDVRRDAPDSVHQLRVSVRRLRSALRTFAPLIVDPGQLRDELGWLAGELADSRDTEVLIDRLLEHSARLPAAEAGLVAGVVDAQLRPRLEAARSRTLDALDSERHARLVQSLVDQLAGMSFTPEAEGSAREVLTPLVRRTWKRLERAAEELDPEGEAATWHRARILGKRARYATDAVVDVLGRHGRARAEALAEVTECLGEHQDAWIAQEALAGLSRAPDVDGAAGFALGLLHEHERELEYVARDRFVELWPRVARAHGRREDEGR